MPFIQFCFPFKCLRDSWSVWIQTSLAIGNIAMFGELSPCFFIISWIVQLSSSKFLTVYGPLLLHQHVSNSDLIVSHSISNVFRKLGKISNGEMDNLSLNAWNASSCSCFQVNTTLFLIISMSGNYRTEVLHKLYIETRPWKLLTSLKVIRTSHSLMACTISSSTCMRCEVTTKPRKEGYMYQK